MLVVKTVALATLILLQIFVAISFKFAINDEGHYDFEPAATLVASEGFKCVMAFFQHVAAVRWAGEDSGKLSITGSFSQAWEDVRSAASLRFCVLIGILSIMYCVNNNLTFAIFALADPATFQLIKSMVPAVTAMIWAGFLDHPMSETEWAAILLQVVGLSMMQYDPCANSAILPIMAYILLGISVMITSTSGVFNEFMVKKLPIPLGIQNFYLYAIGSVVNWIAYVWLVPEERRQHWLLHGVHGWGVVILLCNTFIGLVVTAVYKYADVNLKNFASSGTSAFMVIFSIFFLNLKPTLTLFLGISVVFLSAHVYFVDTVKTQPKLAEVAQDEAAGSSEEGRSLLNASAGAEDDEESEIKTAEKKREEAQKTRRKWLLRCISTVIAAFLIGSAGWFLIQSSSALPDSSASSSSASPSSPSSSSSTSSAVLTSLPDARLFAEIHPSSSQTTQGKTLAPGDALIDVGTRLEPFPRVVFSQSVSSPVTVRLSVIAGAGVAAGAAAASADNTAPEHTNGKLSQAVLLGDVMPWSLRQAQAGTAGCRLEGDTSKTITGTAEAVFDNVGLSWGCCGQNVTIAAAVKNEETGESIELVVSTLASGTDEKDKKGGRIWAGCPGRELVMLYDCSSSVVDRETVGCPPMDIVRKDLFASFVAATAASANREDEKKEGKSIAASAHAAEAGVTIKPLTGTKGAKEILSALLKLPYLGAQVLRGSVIHARQCEPLRLPPLATTSRPRRDLLHAFKVDIDRLSRPRSVQVSLLCDLPSSSQPVCGEQETGVWSYEGKVVQGDLRVEVNEAGEADLYGAVPLVWCDGLLRVSLFEGQGDGGEEKLISQETVPVHISPFKSHQRPQEQDHSSNLQSPSSTPIEVRLDDEPITSLLLRRHEVAEISVGPPKAAPTINVQGMQIGVAVWCNSKAAHVFTRMNPEYLKTSAEGGQFTVQLSLNRACRGLLELALPPSVSEELVYLSLEVAGPNMICQASRIISPSASGSTEAPEQVKFAVKVTFVDVPGEASLPPLTHGKADIYDSSRSRLMMSKDDVQFTNNEAWIPLDGDAFVSVDNVIVLSLQEDISAEDGDAGMNHVMVCAISANRRARVLVHGSFTTEQDVQHLRCAMDGIRAFAKSQPALGIVTVVVAYGGSHPDAGRIVSSVGGEMLTTVEGDSQNPVGVLDFVKGAATFASASAESTITIVHGKGRQLRPFEGELGEGLSCPMVPFDVYGNGQWQTMSYPMEVNLLERGVFRGPPQCAFSDSDFAVTEAGFQGLISEPVRNVRGTLREAIGQGNMPMMLAALGRYVGCDNVCNKTAHNDLIGAIRPCPAA